jgi:catechol 2,3-dioxygenase-like lactoylglutathione lyase family enzyme
MRKLLKATAVFLAMTGAASAEPFQEITVGIPVSSIAEAEAWYVNFLGPDTEMIKPFPGVVEFKTAPGVWLQLFEADNQQPSGAVIRFMVDDMATAQNMRSELDINTGEAIEVPDIITYSEFADPFGNALGLYAVP